MGKEIGEHLARIADAVEPVASRIANDPFALGRQAQLRPFVTQEQPHLCRDARLLGSPYDYRHLPNRLSSFAICWPAVRQIEEALLRDGKLFPAVHRFDAEKRIAFLEDP